VTLVATDGSGSVTQDNVAGTTSSFVGFVSNGALTSLTLTAVQGGNALWPTANNLILAAAAQAGIPASERTVLLDLFTSTGGATWTTRTNWNGAAGTECAWYGVTCNAGGTTVTGIDLNNNNLTGSLPGNLNSLTNLANFRVNNNQLTGPIPALTGLTNLFQFFANDNQLTGSIPELTGLSNLAYFRVNNNRLTGNVPSVPSPSALGAGGSALCANFLIHTQVMAWDIATGDTPWFNSCVGTVPPPTLQSAASRKVHGGAVTFNLPLSP
jgi:hypothetical protein